MKRIYIGTLIESTYNTEGLLIALSDEALRLGLLNKTEKLDVLAALAQPESDHAADILDELFTVLDAAAPEGFYFGAYVGDGADFGFWPSEDFEGEVPDFIDVED